MAENRIRLRQLRMLGFVCEPCCGAITPKLAACRSFDVVDFEAEVLFNRVTVKENCNYPVDRVLDHIITLDEIFAIEERT